MKKKIKLITLFNKEYQVLITRKKIKNTYIRVEDNRIVVSTNNITPYAYIESLIKKNQNKIIELINNNNKLLPNQMLYLGKVYKIICQESSKFSYEVFKEKIIFNTYLSLNESKDLFYKFEAKKIFPYRLRVCYEHFRKFNDIVYPELSIRKMKKRFGTCYYKKNKICLNSFLVKYKEKFIDYVIYHELSLFIHNNHSKAFYKQLKKVCPDYENLKNKLNKY